MAGYAIRNYLNVDPRFGTKGDLVEVVGAAHERGLRVFLDAVANHSGDVFALLCALGAPCIYYGTEQGFSGEGPSDEYIREAMFDLDDPGRDALNREAAIYKGIAALAKALRRPRPRPTQFVVLGR